MATHPVIRVKALAKLPVEKHPNLGKGKVYPGTPGSLVEWNPAPTSGAADGVMIQFDAAIFDNGTGVPKPVLCTDGQFEVTGVIQVDDAQG